MFVYLIFIASFFLLIHLAFNYNSKAVMMNKVPGPKLSFILGNAPEIMMLSSVELMKLARKFASRWDGIYRIWAFPLSIINIYNPDDVEVIVSTTKHNEKSSVYKFLKPWLGDGLLISKGEKWQQRRKILTPAFHFNILRQFSVIIEENSQRLVESLEKCIGKPIDIVPVVSEYTLNSICETSMGTQLSDKTEDAWKAYKDAIYELGPYFFQRFTRVYLYFDIIFYLTSLWRKMKKPLKSLHGFTSTVIKERKIYVEQNGVKFGEDVNDDDLYIYKKRRKTAMLDLLIAAQKDGEIDDHGIQEEVDTFMFEGHDTTASGLTFCFMLLANHRAVQDKIVEEINDIMGDSTRRANLEDLSKMKYLECCIKESLRLYPPVHFISRNLNEPVVLSNYEIPAGSFCHIHIFDLHRRADIYEDPLVYDPDRFSQENSKGRHPYAYIPFSAGPRNCIGQKFAMIEMKSAVAEVLRKYELVPVTRPSEIELIADIILRHSGPVEITFNKRTK